MLLFFSPRCFQEPFGTPTEGLKTALGGPKRVPGPFKVASGMLPGGPGMPRWPQDAHMGRPRGPPRGPPRGVQEGPRGCPNRSQTGPRLESASGGLFGANLEPLWSPTCADFVFLLASFVAPPPIPVVIVSLAKSSASKNGASRSCPVRFFECLSFSSFFVVFHFDF